MVLSNTDESEITRDYSTSEFDQKRQTANLNTENIKAAARAVDTFINNNLITLNNQLPEPFKTRATQKQKLLLLKFVVSRLELKQ